MLLAHLYASLQVSTHTHNRLKCHSFPLGLFHLLVYLSICWSVYISIQRLLVNYSPKIRIATIEINFFFPKKKQNRVHTKKQNVVYVNCTAGMNGIFLHFVNSNTIREEKKNNNKTKKQTHSKNIQCEVHAFIIMHESNKRDGSGIKQKENNAPKYNRIFSISAFCCVYGYIRCTMCKLQFSVSNKSRIKWIEVLRPQKNKMPNLFDHNMRLDCYFFCVLRCIPNEFIEWDKSLIAFHWFLFVLWSFLFLLL